MSSEDEAKLVAKVDDISAKVDKLADNPDSDAMRKAKLGVMQCLHVILACIVIYIFLRVFAVLCTAFVPSTSSAIQDLGLGTAIVFGWA